MEEPTQRFTRRQLGWMRRWHSQAHLRTRIGTRPTTPAEWNDFLDAIESSIAKDSFRFNGLHWHSVRGKRALSTESLEDALVIRKINDNIRRSYGLTQPNRASLIKTAKQALQENTPKTILRIDLKNCFESISRTKLLKQLRADAKVSTQTTALLEVLFRQAGDKLKGQMPEGIPRGLTVSTSLAELRLREFDSKLRTLPGTYLLLRYVDDLLIFTTTATERAWQEVRSLTRDFGLTLNMAKSYPIRVACNCDQSCVHANGCPCKKGCICLSNTSLKHEIEYLGYKIIFAEHNNNKKEANIVNCILSDRKSARIKTRIVRAINDCASNSDWNLLEDRVSYLTANQKVASAPGKRGLFNGLAYTHSEYDEPSNHQGTGTLDDLDKFYRAALRRLISATPAAPPNQQELESLSFASGFKHRRRTKFTPLQVLKIKKCWLE